MKHLILKRVSDNGYATYGVLIYDNTPFAVTLENTWKYNKKNESCIPPEFYNCQRIKSPSHGDCFEIMDVPGRDHILFHKGNIAEDTEGCILIGEMFNQVLGHNGITNSGKGYAEFMNLLKDEKYFQLEIKNVI